MLRIGLLTDGTELRLFDAELVRKIRAAKIAEVVLVIQQELPKKSLLESIRRALARGRLIRAVAFRIAVWIERRILSIPRPELNDLFGSIPVDEVCDAERLPVKPVVSASGWVHRFVPEDVNAIKSRKLDFILRMGSGILRGGILDAAANGIISFHHGDNRTNRGGPPGYWEVFEQRDYTGFIIQRLTEELDAGVVLARGEVATQASYLLNQYRLYKCSITCMVDFLARLGREEAAGGAPRSEAIDWYSNKLYTTPSLPQLFVYQISFWRWLLGTMICRALAGRRVWELRLLRGDWRSLALWKATALTPPRGRFWADPFVMSHLNQKAIFFEEYEYDRGKAHIAALVSTGEGPFTYAGPVINTPYHLSFPYVFRYRGDCYMCPETHQARAIQLWRCTSWPLEWEYHKTLLGDINAADTMIFEHDGRWWLFTNLDREEIGDHCRELHIYHSDSPLSQNWTPLAFNPVVTGASQARNAGLLVRDGKTYRLAQSQGFGQYGRSIKLFEITALSECEYSEKLISELSPARGLNATGIHHLSASEDTVVFDAKRPRFFWVRLPGLSLPQGRANCAAPVRTARSWAQAE
jgi:hypothetical protein